MHTDSIPQSVPTRADAAARFDDLRALDLDERIEREPEIAAALARSPRLLSDLRDLVATARALLDAAARPTEPAPLESHIVDAVPTVEIAIHRVDRFDVGAGEYSVTMNGETIWTCSFVRGARGSTFEASAEEGSESAAHEGAAMFAETVANALRRGAP